MKPFFSLLEWGAAYVRNHKGRLYSANWFVRKYPLGGPDMGLNENAA